MRRLKRLTSEHELLDLVLGDAKCHDYAGFKLHFYDDSDCLTRNRSNVLQEKTTKEAYPNITSLFKCNELHLILNYKRRVEALSRIRRGTLPRHLIDFSDYKIQATENSEKLI